MTRRAVCAVAALVLALIAGCTDTKRDEFHWDLPGHFARPVVPADNPMTAPKVELGRHLFYDTRLSGDESASCASCHLQRLAFTDGRAQSPGITGQRTPRGTMSLANVAYAPKLNWANPLIERLEHQAMVPIFGEEPVEMGMAGRERELIRRLEDDRRYPEMFARAFPGDAPAISVDTLTRALAAFQRSLISARAPYDRYIDGDESALGARELRGMELFFSERLECFHCHGGFTFTDSVGHEGMPAPQSTYHNTGLYNLDGTGAYPAPSTGIHEITRDPLDMGSFKAPTLRNIEVTAPYMHDGSIETLEGVIDHYAAGGRTIEAGPDRGVGHDSPLKSAFVPGFVISPEEKDDLLAFLRALTDESFLADPRHADPFDSRPSRTQRPAT